jgi:hypothetical protein
VLHAQVQEEFAAVCAASVEDRQSGAETVSFFSPVLDLRDKDLAERRLKTSRSMSPFGSRQMRQFRSHTPNDATSASLLRRGMIIIDFM